jgi:hypothetical protein
MHVGHAIYFATPMAKIYLPTAFNRVATADHIAAKDLSRLAAERAGKRSYIAMRAFVAKAQ